MRSQRQCLLCARHRGGSRGGRAKGVTGDTGAAREGHGRRVDDVALATEVAHAGGEAEAGREVADVDGAAAQLGEDAIGLRHDAAFRCAVIAWRMLFTSSSLGDLSPVSIRERCPIEMPTAPATAVKLAFATVRST